MSETQPTDALTLSGTPRFDDDGLIPAICQDTVDGSVLMLAWMNDDALERTLTTTRLRSSDIDPNELIDEVKLDYAHSVNGMLLREGLQRPPLRDKFPSSTLQPKLPPPVAQSGRAGAGVEREAEARPVA